MPRSGKPDAHKGHHYLSWRPLWASDPPPPAYKQIGRQPLLFPEKTGTTCTHEQFKKGKGCRTTTERSNSRFKALGMERPRVRNIHAVRNLTTLTYLLINARALQRARTLNASLFTTMIGKIA